MLDFIEQFIKGFIYIIILAIVEITIIILALKGFLFAKIIVGTFIVVFILPCILLFN
jgi:hypothetical protein